MYDPSSIRLMPKEVDGLIEALRPFLVNMLVKLYLYGSRTQSEKRGGDIDLLLIVSNERQQQELLYEKHIILTALKDAVGDQKIDLCIATEDAIEQDPFLVSIWPHAVLLYYYH